MADEQRPEVRAVMNAALWRECQHLKAGGKDHSCPECDGTLRRCCDSLVGMYPHREGCPELARRGHG